MSKLDKIARKRGTDKSTLRHNYTTLYEKHLKAWANKPIRLLEIGVAYGQSILTWKDYFSNGLIVGLDSFARDPFDQPEVKSKILKSLEHERIKIVIGDQTDASALKEAVSVAGGSFDIIIDDASHVSEDNQWTLGQLFPHLNPGGMYIIEDLQTIRKSNKNIEGAPAERTLKLLKRFVENGTFKSSVLSKESCKSIEDGFRWCKLYYNKIAFMRKFA